MKIQTKLLLIESYYKKERPDLRITLKKFPLWTMYKWRVKSLLRGRFKLGIVKQNYGVMNCLEKKDLTIERINCFIDRAEEGINLELGTN